MASTSEVASGDQAAEKQTVTVTLDGREIEAEPGELLIAAAERNGVYVPRFCYHPRMEPVGMCRMCLVNVEGPRGTSMQVSCMLTVQEGMKVDTQAPEVKKAQDGVLEFLLVNHPLDCPVCDKGGECPLQDQTLTFGPGETRFVEEKRHFEKPIEISPLVTLDRERCILCDRCTRFSKDVAGDPLIHFQDRGNATQVNVFPSHPFSSYFSGNTVQICPVGALTATPYRFKARPWDLEQVESTCMTCSFGERIAVQSSGDALTRYVGIDAEPTNHGWLADKCRFDFESLNSQSRLAAPMTKDANGVQGQADWGSALDAVSVAIKGTTPDRVGVIGGSRLPNEDQYAWAKLVKGVIGSDNFDAQLGDGLPAEAVLGVERTTIEATCKAKAVVLLAPDLKEELPVLYLRLRDAVKKNGLQVIEISPQPTSFTPLSALHVGYRTGDAGAVVAALLGKEKDLPKEAQKDIGGVDPAVLDSARNILHASGGDIVVVYGRQSVAESPQAISDAIGLFAEHSNVRFLPVLRRGNVNGALDMGLAPGVLPGRTSLADANDWYTAAWGKVPAARGLDTTGILQAAAEGALDVLMMLGADPLSDFPDRDLATRALENVKIKISVDILPNASVQVADIVLPAAGFAERSGTHTNIEGRITRLGQKVTAPGVAWPDWVIAAELAIRLDADLGFESIEDIWNEIETVVPTHHGITLAALQDKANRDGLVAPLPIGSSQEAPTGGEEQKVRRPVGSVPEEIKHRVVKPATVPPVDGYGVRLVSGRKLYDLGTHVQFSPHLADLIQPMVLRVNPLTLGAMGIDGETVKVRSSRGEVEVAVKADETIPRDVAIWPFNVDVNSPANHIDISQAVTNVRLETP
jgi:NADH-quinone oxidoreductase subunit G